MKNTLLVETVTGRTMAELLASRDAVEHADMVELRLDGVADVNVAAALEGRKRPAIVTCRPRWEGGQFDGSEAERRQILQEALDRGAEYVDVEWRAGFDDLLRKTGGARVVMSSHDFTGVPSDLAARVHSMRASGAEIVKVAVSATRLTDCLALRSVTRDGHAIAIAMGDSGMPTRLLPTHFGSCWTYSGNGVAPGQIPAGRLVNDFRFRDVSRSTTLFGLVGTYVAGSHSPAMHNGWFARAGIDAVFIPLPTASFADFLEFADALDLQGAAVTIPFKLDALQHASHVDEVARKVGASNTLRRTADGWDATNTDVAGFLAPFASGGAGAYRLEDLRGARASVLGAGGAARAVVVALGSVGARTTVHARRVDQARSLESSGAAVGPWPPQPGSWDVLVNCTPLGGVAAPDASPLPGGPFDGRLVYDLIYRPPETPLMREARAAGCAVITGLPMLRAQAEKQFEYWTRSLCV